MSTTSPTPNPQGWVGEAPEFDLSHRFDDPRDPTTVTVFPGEGADSTTEWITVDTGYALPLEEIR